jgi:hypothetical protein
MLFQNALTCTFCAKKCCTCSANFQADNVSVHSPTRGTAFRAEKPALPPWFQSTRPHEARRIRPNRPSQTPGVLQRRNGKIVFIHISVRPDQPVATHCFWKSRRCDHPIIRKRSGPIWPFHSDEIEQLVRRCVPECRFHVRKRPGRAPTSPRV